MLNQVLAVAVEAKPTTRNLEKENLMVADSFNQWIGVSRRLLGRKVLKFKQKDDQEGSRLRQS